MILCFVHAHVQSLHACMHAMTEVAEREYIHVVVIPVDLIPYIYTQSTLQHTGSETDSMVRINRSVLCFSNQRRHKSMCGKQLPMPACAASMKGLEQPTCTDLVPDLDPSGLCGACFPVVCGLLCASTPQHSSAELWDAYSILGLLNDVGACTCTQSDLSLL